MPTKPESNMPSLHDSRRYIKELKDKNKPRARQIADEVAKKTGYADHVATSYKGMQNKAKASGKKSKKLFDKIDTNKSGTISLNEFTKYCKKRGMSLKKSKKLFKKHDKNGDKKLSRKEFSKIKFRKAKSVKNH